MADIERLLGKDQYDAAMNSSSPTAANPFMTASAVLAGYIPRTGTPPGAPVSGDIVFQETPFPAPNPKLRNEAGGSYVEFYRPFFSAMSGQATNPGTLTGFAYSYFDGFNVTPFYPVGTPIQIKNTQNESNDGIHLITATEWDGVTNWIQWAGMTTEVAAPFGDIAFQWEGTVFSANIPDVLGTKAASAFVDPTGSYFTLRKGVYGTPGYLNGSIRIVDNFAGDVGGFFTYDGYPIVVAGQDYTIRQGVVSSVVGPGRQANVKTNYATYTENIAFNRSSGGTETLFNADKTTNVDRLITLPDESGIVPVGPGWDTLIANPTLGQDGYVIKWDDGAGKYILAVDSAATPTLSAVLTAGNQALGNDAIFDPAEPAGEGAYQSSPKVYWRGNYSGDGGSVDLDAYIEHRVTQGDSIPPNSILAINHRDIDVLLSNHIGDVRSVWLQCPDPITGAQTNYQMSDAGAFNWFHLSDTFNLNSVTWSLTGDAPVMSFVGALNGNLDLVLPNVGTGLSKQQLFQNNDGTIALLSDVQTGQTYNVANVTTDRDYDANASTVGELADVLGTLVTDLQNIGILS